jgi:hypothetical protein
MVHIGLLSDNHGYWPQEIEKYFENVDEIWHAGDIGSIEILDRLEKFKPCRAVWGNIDGHQIRQRIPERLSFQVEDCKVAMIHIGGYPPKYNKSTLDWLEKERPHLFISGHSHILKVIKDPALNLLHLNPGACGQQGWHQVKTIMRLSIDHSSVKNLEVLELGKRGALKP